MSSSIQHYWYSMTQAESILNQLFGMMESVSLACIDIQFGPFVRLKTRKKKDSIWILQFLARPSATIAMLNNANSNATISNWVHLRIIHRFPQAMCIEWDCWLKIFHHQKLHFRFSARWHNMIILVFGAPTFNLLSRASLSVDYYLF